LLLPTLSENSSGLRRRSQLTTRYSIGRWYPQSDLSRTRRARADGVNVIGYMYWSLTDNFERGSYVPRFGLFTLNVRTDPGRGHEASARRRTHRRL
jgi:beta-glucosidase/6-phospho-beta-glucosidase/beta-galactosidase